MMTLAALTLSFLISFTSSLAIILLCQFSFDRMLTSALPVTGRNIEMYFSSSKEVVLNNNLGADMRIVSGKAGTLEERNK